MEPREKAAQLPESPGVYLFKDAGEKILYVGKARNLRSRVRSYFLESRQRAGLGINPARFEEVGTHAAAQVARLANIKDLLARILEEIDARTFGKLRGFFAGFHGGFNTQLYNQQTTSIILDGIGVQGDLRDGHAIRQSDSHSFGDFPAVCRV